MSCRKRQSFGYTPRKVKCVFNLKRQLPPENKAVCNTKVCVRVRPPNAADANNRAIVDIVDENILIFDPKEEYVPFYVRGQRQINRDILKKQNKAIKFIFDRVFNENATNKEVFQETTSNLSSYLLEGFNCSVFVYGATGAGKTYTMLGNKSTPGIVYLTMVDLYNKMNTNKETIDFEVKISYLEVYNETVKDLICPSGPLDLRDDGKNGIVVAGIQSHKISDAEELFHMLEQGNKNRTQHPTDTNAESSRSHAIFQVHLHMKEKLSTCAKVAKLTMIDLAGSERGSATGCKGPRFSEGSNINKSLLALGNCVNALADGQKHVPYRNSKLTRLLKDSLGGNSRTVMIVNIAPSSLFYEETLNTLHYASRAKKINMKIHSNTLSIDIDASRYKKINEEQQIKIAALTEELRILKETKEAKSEKFIATKRNAEIEKAKQILKNLYELKEKCSKEIYIYKIKVKNLQWRILQKQTISKRLAVFQTSIANIDQNITHMDDSIENFKSQLKCYKEKEKGLIYKKREYQKLLNRAIQDIKEKEIYEDLISDIQSYVNKMNHEITLAQVSYYKHLFTMQQRHMQNNDTIISTLIQTVKQYYSILHGYGKTTRNMKEEYAQLVNLLMGRKEVTWEDNPKEPSILKEDYFSFSPNSMISDDNCESPVANLKNEDSVQKLQKILPYTGDMASCYSESSMPLQPENTLETLNRKSCIKEQCCTENTNNVKTVSIQDSFIDCVFNENVEGSLTYIPVAEMKSQQPIGRLHDTYEQSLLRNKDSPGSLSVNDTFVLQSSVSKNCVDESFHEEIESKDEVNSHIPASLNGTFTIDSFEEHSDHIKERSPRLEKSAADKLSSEHIPIPMSINVPEITPKLGIKVSNSQTSSFSKRAKASQISYKTKCGSSVLSSKLLSSTSRTKILSDVNNRVLNSTLLKVNTNGLKCTQMNLESDPSCKENKLNVRSSSLYKGAKRFHPAGTFYNGDSTSLNKFMMSHRKL